MKAINSIILVGTGKIKDHKIKYFNKSIQSDCQFIVCLIFKASKIAKATFSEKSCPVNDYLFLKRGISSVYNHIKVYSKNSRKEDLYETLKNVSFSQFIILLLKMNEQKDILFLLLSSVRVLPVYLKVVKPEQI